MTKLYSLFTLLLTLMPFAVIAQSTYDGALFDTSCQGGLENNKYQGTTKAKHFINLWNAHNVEGATMFVGIDVSEDDDDDEDEEAKPGDAAAYLKKLKKTLKSKDVKFFMNIGAQSSDGPKKGLKLSLYKKALSEIKIKFKKKNVIPNVVSGVGEIEQYAWTDQDFHVDNMKMMNFLTKFVDKKGFPFFMVHFPGGPNTTNFKKLGEIETSHFANLLTAYSDRTFLIHLFLPDFVELADSGDLDSLLTDYPNWIFSVDVGNIMGRWQNDNFMCPLMYCCDQDGTCTSNDTDPAPEAVDAFISEYDSTSSTSIAKALAIYQSYIEAYPDRFAWGSENGKLWHMNSEVYSRIIDFSRRFIGSLDPSVQEAFARGNARRVFLGE